MGIWRREPAGSCMVIVESVDKGRFQAVLIPVYADFGKRFGQENIDRIKNTK